MTDFTTIPWRTAWKSRKFRIALIFSMLSLLVCAWAAPHIFGYIQARSGTSITDPLLDLLPALDLSPIIFFLLYSLIFTTVLYLSRMPFLLLQVLQGYVLLTVLRYITLLITPLEIPEGLIVLSDPFTDRFLYQQVVTKDLFFSGHTAIIFLFAFCVRHNLLRAILFAGGSAIGIMVLVQHAHYTIDVLAAPAIAWAAARAGSYLSRQSGYMNIQME